MENSFLQMTGALFNNWASAIVLSGIFLLFLVSALPRASYGDDPVPIIQLSAAGYEVDEDNGTITLTILVEGVPNQSIFVNYSTQDFTAIAGDNYVAAVDQQLEILTSEASKTFDITINYFPGYNPDTQFFINLSAPRNADLGTNSSTVITIVNVDGPPELQFEQGSYTVNEDDGSIAVSVVKSGTTNVNAQIHYTTTDDTAIAGQNYSTTSGDLVFLPSDTSKTITIPIINAPGYNLAKIFFINLSDPVNASLGVNGNASVVISNIDPVPSLLFNLSTYIVDEDANTVTINVTKDGITDQVATVVYSTHDGTARAGQNYSATSGTLTFLPADTSLTFTIDIAYTPLYNTDTEFYVNLSAATGATISTDSASVTIRNVDPYPPVADFTANVTGGFAPLCVLFTDSSSNYPNAWQWDFGDVAFGTANATEQNPVHVYADPGTYHVTLTASNGGGNAVIQKAGYIIVQGRSPVAAFTANESAGLPPMCVQFSDASTYWPTAWAWDFGDEAFGSANTTEQNPVHTYSSPGIYTVTLTAFNDNGSSTLQMLNYIEVATPMIPVADFGSNVTSGIAPCLIWFFDASTGLASSWQWDFGDVTFGTANATVRNPQHLYTSPGTYTVTLTAGNVNGTKTVQKSEYNILAPTVPSADFGANATVGVAPLAVTFTDLSSGFASSWEWDFGDATFGTANSTAQSPEHLYSVPGTYTVTMTAINANGTSTAEKAGLITVLAPTFPAAGFAANTTSGVAPLCVSFTDASTGFVSSWEWDFGDKDFGTANATDQSPVHTYDAPGTFTVTLTAINANGTSTVQQSDYIVASAPSIPVANFGANVTVGVAPCAIAFLDASVGFPAEWQWDFGDAVPFGSANITEQSPVHIYSSPGTYTVTLTVKNPNGTDTLQRSDYLIILAPTVPSADFSANRTTAVAPCGVTFTDASTGFPSSWEWDFGDAVPFGSANVSDRNPVHYYAAPGTYTVTMTAINANGTNTVQRTSLITVIAPTLPAADFTVNRTDGVAPLAVAFTDLSSGFASSWQWDFGDGTANGTEQDPVHVYNGAGTFTVTLTAINANGTSAIERVDYVAVIAPSIPVANFTANRTSGTAPLGIAFTDLSAGASITWEWDFGDVAFGSANDTTQNPYHLYASPGTYTVTLTVSNANGTSTLQRTSYITAVMPAPIASFTVNASSGVAPLCVQFTDTSTNSPTAWQWDFGDGTANATVRNPVHVYGAAGIYNVTLTASNAGGSGGLRNDSCITVTAAEVTFDLVFDQGWNIISLPVIPSNNSISSIFSAAQQANIDVIWDFNGGDWKFWTTEPGYTNQFFNISPLRGYYFYCYNAMTVEITGAPGTGVISWDQLASGWNMIGFPSLSNASIGDNYGAAVVIWKMENNNWFYWTTEPGYTNQFEELSAGLGYWVYKT